MQFAKTAKSSGGTRTAIAPPLTHCDVGLVSFPLRIQHHLAGSRINSIRKNICLPSQGPAYQVRYRRYLQDSLLQGHPRFLGMWLFAGFPTFGRRYLHEREARHACRAR